jgi:murein L,D-transpeptidase YcbB/YkuD
MRIVNFAWATQLRTPMVVRLIALLCGIIFTGLVLAQPRGTAVAPPAPHPAQAAAQQLEPGSEVAAASTLPDPTFDEGTAQRIAAAMLSYSAIQVRGGWRPLPQSSNLVPGASGTEVALLRQRLAVTEDLPADTAATEVYDAAVIAAVRRFQGRHGLAETGTISPKTLAALNVPVAERLRQLSASLDRLAAMDFTFGQRYVIVNLPAGFAEAVEGDKVVRRFSVRVGNSNRPSPTLTTYIAAVNLNPAWSVPLAITKKDIIPRMRKDPGYLARMHMRVLDSNGADKDPKTVDWNSNRTPNFIIRQDPGAWNALGNLRVTMPNLQTVFMHELNRNELPDRGYEIESSGCTALSEMRDFASWLLQDAPVWGHNEIDSAIAKGDQVEIRLPHKVPVAWVYFTGWVTRSGLIQFRDDIYNRDSVAERPLLTDTQRPTILTAGRASGFVLQSAESSPEQPTSYLDRQ